ncbi:alpha/beta hydrolase [Pelagibacterium lentulum]|uniref:Serine aminopeptidase S33 domain-containing protein n=1 Tax=Pelagibacterium lentulum TaxID=2029865 RepID=A0A916RKM3_9HYPH|nr:alpha/beta hydrolase [Pelagibacterium lentulum]GGA58875.1 hypothetical protein GCM10011499_31260 [Pelagibacterium lentulum]
MQEERFEFDNAGARLVGVLYRPDGDARGAVVTTGPLTSVKEQAAGVYARAMAERGYAALAFDHRTFGESEGEPRQFENPLGKADDIVAAITALDRDARTAGLPVYALGVCAGGGYMARAVSDDKRVTAFAGIAGVYPDAQQTRTWMGENYQAALDRAAEAEKCWRETGQAETIPAVAAGNGDVAMPLDEAFAYYGTPRGAVDNYVNGFAVQSRAYTLPFDVQEIAERITVPSIIVHSENALMPDLARRFYAALAVEKEQLWLQSQGQIDFYDDPALIAPAADAVARFFARRGQ